MGFVVALNIFVIILAFLARFKKKDWCLAFGFIVLTAVYAIRYDYGNDYWGYYDVFLECQNFSLFDLRTEIGWNLLNKLFGNIGYFGLIVFLTVTENFIVYKYIRKNVDREWWWLAVFIFVFTFNFMLLGLSMMRQYLAMVLCLHASQYIYKKKLWMFLLFMVLAISVHKTSAIFLFMYAFAYVQPKLNSNLFVLIFVSLVSVMLVLTDRLSGYFDFFMTLSLLEDYTVYADWEEGKKSITMIFDLLILGVLLKTAPNDNSMAKVNCNIVTFGYLIWPFTLLLILLIRVQLYFSFLTIVCVPYASKKIKKKFISNPLLLLFILLTLRRFFASITGDTYGYYYETFKTIFSAPNWL